MDFGLSDEQQQLGDAERGWLTKHDPIERLRAALDHQPVTIDPAGIAHLAESGLLALLTDDVGGTHVDLEVLAEAHGWAASSVPIADLAIATCLLEAAGAPQAASAAQGTALYGVARLSSPDAGTTTPIPMAADLDGIVVLADDEDSCAIIDAPELTTMQTLDLSRSWARVRVVAGSGARFALPCGTVEFVRDALALHRAVDAVGAADRLLQMTVAYTGQRRQFGVPIGSFQAVKHHCADMAIGVEAGRAALWAAALALDTASAAERRHQTSAAVAYAKNAAAEIAGTALQVHGGIGFTWEHDLHLLLRRIKVNQAMDGTVAEHRAALVSR